LLDVTKLLHGDCRYDALDFLPFNALPHINHLQGNDDDNLRLAIEFDGVKSLEMKSLKTIMDAIKGN